jgi:uncharacterized protein YfcZ (UPF0381/DUF406 family)
MILATAIAGCSASERGEYVFTRQNQAASALAMIAMDAEMRGSSEIKDIYATETKLDKACALLTEAATQKMSGETMPIDFELMVWNSLDDCATETKNTEQFVWRANAEVAKFYLGDPPMVLTTPH